jgi:S-(hydroxymethyl)glutathione dehydrogenase/alcohol dehydrogenase
MQGIVFDGEAARVVDDLGVTPTQHDQVRVRIAAAGVCHSDASVIDPSFAGMYEPPFVVGHEGAGVVVETGRNVTSVKVGDHVVITTFDNCGLCAVCVRGKPSLCQNSRFGAALANVGRKGRPSTSELPAFFTWRGDRLIGMANTGVFAEEVVVGQRQVVAIDEEVPFESACLIGCGVLTGTGAVFNRARVYRGHSVAVVGVGGIGLNVIQAARIAGATRIVAIDSNPAKESFARRFGATAFVHSQEAGSVEAVLDLTSGGVDHAFECVGQTRLMRDCIDMLRPGGQAILLGVAGIDAQLTMPPFLLYQDKSVMGCRYGSSRPADDIPALIDLYLDGRLLLDELVSERYELDELDRALGDLHEGKLARGVISLLE